MKQRFLQWRWICAATLIFLLVMIFTGPQDCDFLYMRMMPSIEQSESPHESFTAMEGELITTPAQWWESIKNHRLYHDNGRLANYIAMGQNMIPHWVYDIFLTFCYGLLLTMMLDVAGLRRSSAGAVAAMALAMWWFLTWEAPMLSVDYLLNYLCAGALSLAFVRTVTRPQCRFTLTAALLAVTGSMMHEGFSACFSCGLFVWLVARRCEITRQQLILCLIFFAGALFVTLSPSLIYRMLRSTESTLECLPVSLVSLLRDNCIIIIGAGLILWTLIKRPRLFLTDTMLILITTAAASTVVFIVTHSPARALWPEQMSLVAISFICLGNHFRTLLNRIAIPLWIVLTAWAGSLVWWQYVFSRDEKILEDSASDIVYADIATFEDTPVWLGYAPSGPGTFSGVFIFKMMDTHLRKNHGRWLSVFFPEAYRRSFPQIEGTAGAKGSFPYFVFPKRTDGNDFQAMVTLGPGNFWKCKNLVMAAAHCLTGKLSKPITHEITFSNYRDIVIGSDTLTVCTPNFWFIGSTEYGRDFIRIDTISQR